jgi:HK97 family phage prohead protease
MAERKFVDLKALKVSDEGAGVIEGYRSVFGVIDEGGDIVVKGAFADSLSEYLHSGFTAQSHDWDFKEAVGFPLEAYEDDHGWFVKSQFHSTPDAQAIRTKAKERLEAGKQVGFSFGYAPKKFLHIEAKDYEAELPKYISADLLPAMLKKAQDFNRIRVLKSVEAIEDSIVTAPMNKRAAATGVKSEGKGMLAEEMAATTPSTWDVQSAFSRVIRKIAEGAKNSDITGEFDWKAKATLACSELGSEMTPLVISQIQEFLDSSDDEFYLKGIAGTESFESFEAAGTELTKFAQKMRSNHEIRVKEGRMLSSSNRTKVQACKDAMSALIADLDELLAISEPKPKEKEINVEALRTQSLRMRSLAIRALA